MGFGDTAAGQLAIIVTELANNLHRHARSGELVFQPLHADDRLGVEILSIDRGPGLANVAQAMKDGYSTGGTSGTGLGAVRRLAHEFDLFSEPEKGTVLMARLWPTGKPAAARVQVTAVCLPLAGEEACGDAWAVVDDPATGRTAIIVADGLGHGTGAAQASRRAIDIFRQNAARPPARLIELVHAGLRGTRGAAVAVLELLRGQSKINFAGVGNISAMLLQGLKSKSLVSHNGTAGVEARRIQEFSYAWTDDTLLVMHSDGLTQHWSLAAHRGLMIREPSVMAGVLYRDHRRVRDDVTVLIARETPAE